MGFFTFLTGEQDDPFALQEEQAAIRRKQRQDQENPRDGSLPGSTKGPMQEYKPYSQRRGETSSQVFQAADKIVDKIAKAMPFGGTVEATDTKRAIRANPDNAAKLIERLYETAKKVGGGTDFSGKPLLGELYDQDFSALEQGVRSLRTMKRGVEEKSLTEGLAGTDLNKNLSELQNLKGQLDVITKEIATAKETMPEAVSSRGEQEQKNIIGDKQQRAAALAEHIKQLEAMTAGQGPIEPVNAPPAVPPSTASTLPQIQEPIHHFMEGLGMDREFVNTRVHSALTAIGIPAEEWGSTNVNPSAGMMRAMSALDKDGAFARLIVQEISLARQQDMADQQNQTNQPQPQPQQQGGTDYQENPAIARTEARIQSREQEIRQLYAQLRESPFMRTWPGIILYVLVGMLTQNPAFAARLIGGVGNRDAVDKEIRGIQFELRRLDSQLERQEREEVYSKREAAKRLQHKEDVADQRKWEMSKLMVNHNLIIQRNAARGNPETFIMKKLAGDFQRSLGMASKFQSEMDQYARTMNNELADQTARADAKRKWADAKRKYDHYMMNASGLDAQIQDMGGAAAEPEQVEE
jgi:hypothetical protein